MRKLIFGLLLTLTISFNASSKSLSKPESTVMVCGDTPGGVYLCITYVYNDGWDCLIIDNEGAPGGIYYGAGCDI